MHCNLPNTRDIWDTSCCIILQALTLCSHSRNMLRSRMETKAKVCLLVFRPNLLYTVFLLLKLRQKEYQQINKNSINKINKFFDAQTIVNISQSILLGTLSQRKKTREKTRTQVFEYFFGGKQKTEDLNCAEQNCRDIF